MYKFLILNPLYKIEFPKYININEYKICDNYIMKNIKVTTKSHKIGSYIIDGLMNKEQGREIKIPLFQRDYIWGLGESAEKLLDSLLLSYPIGAITVRRKREIIEEAPYYINYLIDGLQRSFTIVNIHQTPWKFVSNKIVFHLFNIFSEDKIPEHPKTEEDKKKKHTIKDHVGKIILKIKEINTAEKFLIYMKELKTKGTTDDVQIRNQAVSSIYTNIYNWATNIDTNSSGVEPFHDTLYTREIPVITINDAKDRQVAEIFNVMNANGKPLNTFEKNASLWAEHLISKDNAKGFTDIIKQRTDSYCKMITNNDSDFERCKINLREKKDGITPADLLYSILSAVLEDPRVKDIKELFSGPNGNVKDIEMLTYLVMEQLDKNNWEFENFGIELKDKVDLITASAIKEKIIISVERFIEKMPLISYAQSAKDKNNIFNLVGLAESFVIFAINQMSRINEEEFKKIDENTLLFRFLETKVISEHSLSTGSSKKAQSAAVNMRWIKNLNNSEIKNLEKLVNEQINHGEIYKKNFSIIDKILSVVLDSTWIYSNKGRIHFDHIIPKSFMGKNYLDTNDIELSNLINSVYNTQILEEGKNISKGNRIFPKQLNYDIEIVNQKDFHLSKDEYKEHLETLNLMKNKNTRTTNNKEAAIESAKTILKARKIVIDRKIKELFK